MEDDLRQFLALAAMAHSFCHITNTNIQDELFKVTTRTTSIFTFPDSYSWTWLFCITCRHMSTEIKHQNSNHFLNWFGVLWLCLIMVWGNNILQHWNCLNIVATWWYSLLKFAEEVSNLSVVIFDNFRSAKHVIVILYHWRLCPCVCVCVKLSNLTWLSSSPSPTPNARPNESQAKVPNPNQNNMELTWLGRC